MVSFRVRQIGYGVWALGSLAIFIVIAYRFNSYRKEISGDVSLRLLLLISSSFSLGDLLGYFVGQLTHNAAMENQDALNKIFIHVPFYLYLVVAGFIIPIMEEIIF